MNIVQIIESEADRSEQLRGYACPGNAWTLTPLGSRIYFDSFGAWNPSDIEAIGKYALVSTGHHFGKADGSENANYIDVIDQNIACGFYPNIIPQEEANNDTIRREFGYLYRGTYTPLYSYSGKIIGILEKSNHADKNYADWAIRITNDFSCDISRNSTGYDIISKDFVIGKKIGYETYFRARKQSEAYFECSGFVLRVANTIEELLEEKKKLEGRE